MSDEREYIVDDEITLDDIASEEEAWEKIRYEKNHIEAQLENANAFFYCKWLSQRPRMGGTGEVCPSLQKSGTSTYPNSQSTICAKAQKGGGDEKR